MKRKKLISLCLVATMVFSIVGCNNDKSSKNNRDDDETEDVVVDNDDNNETEANVIGEQTDAVVDETIYMYWLNQHINSAGITVNESNILPFYEGLSIDEVYDYFKDWYCIDQSDPNEETRYKTMEEMYDKTISSYSFLSFTMKETRELSASFEDGPMGIFTIEILNPTDSAITVGEAVENQWYFYAINNSIDAYHDSDSALYISLGYTSEYGHVNRTDNTVVMEEYLVPYLGEINYLSVNPRSEYQTVEALCNADFTTYNIGWIGTEYAVFTCVSKDWLTTMNTTGELEFNNVIIVPANVYEYSEYFLDSFIGSGYRMSIEETNMLG